MSSTSRATVRCFFVGLSGSRRGADLLRPGLCVAAGIHGSAVDPPELKCQHPAPVGHALCVKAVSGI